MATTRTVPTVLLIEPDPTLRELEKDILDGARYHVACVPDGEDPVDYAALMRPNVIVVHVRRPDPADQALIDRLHIDPATKAIPVVAVSMSEEVAARSQAGPTVNQAVVAPYNIASLEAAVANALANPPPAAVLPPTDHPISGPVSFAAGALSQQVRQIVLATVERLQKVEPYKSRFAEISRDLVDDLGEALEAIATGLQRGLSPSEVFAVPVVRGQIDKHILTRKEQGKALEAIVREYQILQEEVERFLHGLVGRSGFTAADFRDTSAWVHIYIKELNRIATATYAPNVTGPTT